MSSKAEIEAGAAILKDLCLFNKAAIFMELQIEPKITSVVSEFVNVWIEENQWAGDVKPSLEFQNMWFCPSEWAPKNWKEEGIESPNRFSFGYKPEEDNSYVVADLFGAGESKFGIRFKAPSYSSRKTWNTYAQRNVEKSNNLRSLKWEDDGKGLFFLPVALPESTLVEAWKTDNWAETLQPLGHALDTLLHARPIFDDILAVAKLKPE